MPRITHVLFDVDGVLLDSARCYRRVWHKWAEMRHLDPTTVSEDSEGHRSNDTIMRVASHLDPKVERLVLDQMTKQELDSVLPFPGAKRLLEALEPGSWAIVTSGDQWAVHRCFRAHALPLPSVQVYGDCVRAAKPAPECYELAASKLRVKAEDCLVVEDSLPGVVAGKTAGCVVVVIATTCGKGLRAADYSFQSLCDAAPFIQSAVGGRVAQ
jgi:sugar-phosphatase